MLFLVMGVTFNFFIEMISISEDCPAKATALPFGKTDNVVGLHLIIIY